MLAAIFIQGGVVSLREPEDRAKAAEPVSASLVSKLPFNVPEDPVTQVRISGAIKVAAGGLLAIGRLPRLAALALAADLVPTTLAGHRFWAETDPAAKAGQRIQFFKNVSMLGGLLLAAVDTEGKPSVGWRARRARRDAKRNIKAAQAATRAAAKSARATSKTAGKTAGKAAGKTSRKAARSARRRVKTATSS